MQAVFGAKTSSARFFVQIPGSAAQLSVNTFLRRLAVAYVQAFQEQVMVSAACNGAHGLKERLARGLLMMRESQRRRHPPYQPGLAGRHGSVCRGPRSPTLLQSWTGRGSSGAAASK